MKVFDGILRKMHADWQSPVQYSLKVNEEKLMLNEFLNKKIHLQFMQQIFCIQCERKITRSFQQGYCYPCYQRLLECNLCSIHPERCRCEEGHCKADDWAHAHCVQKHVIYLANSSGLKVGITRHSQIPTRWIDQGATQALVIMEVQNRLQAGLVEVALKNFVADKTNWRKMLTEEQPLIDLNAVAKNLLQEAQPSLQPIIDRFGNNEINFVQSESIVIDYPVPVYPKKIVSLDLDKQNDIVGTLMGIKGQYLIFDHGVINLRKYGGYQVALHLGVEHVHTATADLV